MKRNKTAVNFASLAIIIIILCFLESNVYSTVKKDSGKSAIKPKAQTNDSEKKISLDFDNMDLRDLVLYLNEYAKINYILPANLTGKISVVSPEKIPVSMIPDVLETLLNMNGFATSLNDSYTMIVPISSAKTEPDKIIKLNDTAPLTNKVVLKIIEPKYAAAAVIANTIRQIITSDIRIVVDNSMNRLFITGYGPLIKKFVDLIEIMDVPDVESKILVYKIKNNLAATIATKAAQILTALNSQKGITAPFQIIADEFSNKIVVVSLS
ncbi:MAG TPA: secretin N-terminal domain-containing protein, partial [bacterium]|nr:secretin N-terminal domain-containing protein [bacterium]